MSRRLLRLGLALAVLVTALPARAEPEETTAPETVLKEKGLRRAGSLYTLPAEAEVQKALNTARGLYQSVVKVAARKQQFEASLKVEKFQMIQMEQQLVFLNQQLSQASTAEENNRLIGMINALTGQVNLYRRRESDPDANPVPSGQFATLREEFIQAVLDLRQLVDKTNAAYDDLNKDDAVKSALDALNQKTKAKVALGPSKTYLANVKLLEKVEGSVLSETVALRKEGGVHWVDVTFNGKTTRPMVFDTGASIVALPAEMATEIGLKPGPNDPTVKMQVADGSIVEAKRMIIPSVRLGKFTVKDVECVVMPPGKADVPPLLGQTFQRHFTFKFTADSGQLVLSRIETPETEAPVAKGKSSSKTARGKR